MLKRKEYRVCDRCFKELDDNGHIELCDALDTRFYDLCDNCYEEYASYRAEMDELLGLRHKIAVKYKFGPYLPKEEENER